MFAPTKQMQQVLADTIRKEPLARGEFRRVVGMGETYVSLDGEPLPPEYTAMMTLTVDGTRYRLLYRTASEA
jgi:hypothetical protein